MLRLLIDWLIERRPHRKERPFSHSLTHSLSHSVRQLFSHCCACWWWKIKKRKRKENKTDREKNIRRRRRRSGLVAGCFANALPVLVLLGIQSLKDSTSEKRSGLNAGREGAGEESCGASGMSVSRPLFFGTRRTTHSDVISVTTTIVPQGRDLGVSGRAPLPQTGSIEEASAELNKQKKPQPFTNAEYLSPLYDLFSHRPMSTRGVTRHCGKSMQRSCVLCATEASTGKGKFAGASALQRLWRGYLP